jgi:hypothetical protein
VEGHDRPLAGPLVDAGNGPLAGVKGDLPGPGERARDRDVGPPAGTNAPVLGAYGVPSGSVTYMTSPERSAARDSAESWSAPAPSGTSK